MMTQKTAMQQTGKRSSLRWQQRPRPPKLKPLLRLDDFSERYRDKAAALLKLLNSSGDVAYNSNMEFVHKGQPVQDSNIIALIEHALTKDKHQLSKLKGMKRFYTMLNKLGIPSHYYYKM